MSEGGIQGFRSAVESPVPPRKPMLPAQRHLSAWETIKACGPLFCGVQADSGV